MHVIEILDISYPFLPEVPFSSIPSDNVGYEAVNWDIVVDPLNTIGIQL